MSHDQRPGKIRVVQNGAVPADRRSGANLGVDARTKAEAAASTAVAAGPAAFPAADMEKRGLPLLPATLFLLACIGGGIAFAILRPFGIG